MHHGRGWLLTSIAAAVSLYRLQVQGIAEVDQEISAPPYAPQQQQQQTETRPGTWLRAEEQAHLRTGCKSSPHGKSTPAFQTWCQAAAPQQLSPPTTACRLQAALLLRDQPELVSDPAAVQLTREADAPTQHDPLPGLDYAVYIYIWQVSGSRLLMV